MHRIIKNEQMENGYVQTHCFPAIPSSHGGSSGQRASSRRVFQRLDFIETKGSVSDVKPEQAGAGTATNDTAEFREQAFREGYVQGEKAGMEKGAKKIEPVLNNFRQALTELEKTGKQLFRHAEEQTVDLALAVARKIVCHEVSLNREVVINVVKEALKRVADQEKITIRVNPVDVELIRDPRCQLSSVLEKGESIIVEADACIPAGGCMIDTQLGGIDARIEEQLKTIEEAFKAELKKCEVQD